MTASPAYLKDAIAAYERTQKGPHICLVETTEAADTLAKGARAYLAAQEDEEENNEDGLSAEAFGRVEGDSQTDENLSKPAETSRSGVIFKSPLWTPVEDGLPEKGQIVWVTRKRDSSVDWVVWGGGYEKIVMAWKPADVPAPYQPPKPVDPLTVAVEALEKIASRHVTKDPLWWQRAAREALEQVQGEE